MLSPSWKLFETAFSFYKSKGLDMFKDGLSVPGLTLKYLFSTVDPGVHFTLIDEKNKDQHELIKN